MSDRSSNSSCEWILLDENEENKISGNPESQSELNYDCIHLAASECINSSLEELPGIDDLFNIDNINSRGSQFRISCGEDLQLEQLGTDISEDGGNDLGDSDVLSQSEDADIIISSISKNHCYKHKRNDHVNHILNMLLALVLSTAIGLGAGHFIGWSHKCYNASSIYYYSGFISSLKVSDESVVKKSVKLLMSEPEEILSIPPTSENSSFVVNWKVRSDNANIIQDTCHGDSCTNEIPDTSEVSLTSSDNSIEEEPFKEVPYSYSTAIGSSDVRPILTEFELSEISRVNVLKNQPQAHIPDIEHKPFAVNENFISHNQYSNDEYNIISNQIEMLTQFYSISDEYTGNLTTKLYLGLNKVVQSLNAVAITQLYNTDKVSSKTNNDMQLITKQFNDFQNHLESKIVVIDNFMKDTGNKKLDKQNFKFLEKMVYSLVDSVDYIIKASIRTFGGDLKKINVFKFSKNISKIIFNFEKRWEKIRKDGFGFMERSKHQDSKEKKSIYKSKQWKTKDQVERDSDKNGKKYKRYNMRS